MLHAISHEGAHSLDKANGWKSESGEWGPFGKSGRLDEAGKPSKGIFSTTEETDYVSTYAQAHSGQTLAREDFAQTPSFITTFHHLKTKPELGALSPTLVEKIRGAGRVIGTPPEQIEALLNHYQV